MGCPLRNVLGGVRGDVLGDASGGGVLGWSTNLPLAPLWLEALLCMRPLLNFLSVFIDKNAET